MQRIEASEDQFTKGIITASEHALARAASQQFPRMTNRIRAGSAGIGNDGDRAAKAKGIGENQGLALGLIMRHARRLAALATTLRSKLR